VTRSNRWVQVLVPIVIMLLSRIARATPVDNKYEWLRQHGFDLGSPIRDEAVLPDGIGHFRVYRQGSIYWHPSIGAFEVHGAIRELWASLNWEKGWLGYPTSDESTMDGGRYNNFQHGSIYWSPGSGAVAADIVAKFDHAQRNDGESMHHHLKMYRDGVTIEGTVLHSPHGDCPDGGDRSYHHFLCDLPRASGEDPPDCDINIDIALDRNKLDAIPGFWASGWKNDASQIRAKLDADGNTMHCEVVMYARSQKCDNPSDPDAPELPGWMEAPPSAVTLNGVPLNGRADFAPDGSVKLLGRSIAAGTPIRLRGFLALDCHWGGVLSGIDCSEDDADFANVEIHPVYSIETGTDPCSTQRSRWAVLNADLLDLLEARPNPPSNKASAINSQVLDQRLESWRAKVAAWHSQHDTELDSIRRALAATSCNVRWPNGLIVPAFIQQIGGAHH